MSAATNKQDQVSFEEAMERLEEIVSSMEGERLPLEEMVHSYEEGAKLLRVCRERIETARQRVELITANLDGAPTKATLTTFDPASAEAAEPSPTPTETSPKQRAASQPAARRKPTTDDDEDIRLF